MSVTDHEGLSEAQYSGRLLDGFNLHLCGDRHGVGVLDLVQLVGCMGVLDWDHQGEVEESIFQAVLPAFLSQEDGDEVEEEWGKHPEDSEEGPGVMDLPCNIKILRYRIKMS